jgi:hypothetical protein
MKNLLFVVLIGFIVTDCCNPEPKKEKKIREMETLILLQSPAGLRIEYNIDKKLVEIWICPQVGKTLDYKLVNFSNRDDHTSVFDRITIPYLKIDDYDSCTYDPFHSIVHFKNQKVHIATLSDKSLVVIWFEKTEMVDFKSDKADEVIHRDSSNFIIRHSDRGLKLCYVSSLGSGSGYFQQQLVIDEGRSTYARAHLAAGQPVYISGELEKENVPQMIKELQKISLDTLLAQDNIKIEKEIEKGRIVIKDDPKLQHLLDFNRRIWFSMQDLSGTVKNVSRIYNMIWVREGGLACPYLGYTGWVKTLEKFNEFNLVTPTIIENEEPKGIMFGQLSNPKINKWEEDGTFYTVWSAFTHWTQTGDPKFIKGKYLENMEASMNWLERYCWDSKKGLYFRYYFCETPLIGSRDDGWDNAVGFAAPEWSPGPYKGQVIKKSYDVYINLLNYNCYVMLSMMTDGKKSDKYLAKSKIIGKNIQKYFHENELPNYGALITDKKDTMLAVSYGLDTTDYVWALTLCPFYPDMAGMEKVHQLLFKNIQENKNSSYFLAAYFSILAALEPELVNQTEVMDAVHHVAKQCYEPWEYLPFAYSITEMSHPQEPNSGHYLRPQLFSMGPWIASMANFGVRRLPWGIAIRSNNILNKIEKYEYMGSIINFEFKGNGKAVKIMINGNELKNSRQIPVGLVQKGQNSIVVEMIGDSVAVPELFSSTVTLNFVSKVEKHIEYIIEAHGLNVLVFRNTDPNKISVTDSMGSKIECVIEQKNGLLYATFEGKGKYKVVLEL